VLLFKIGINTVFTSEFLAPDSLALLSLISPAPPYLARDILFFLQGYTFFLRGWGGGGVV
jgi:hypothetical protein